MFTLLLPVFVISCGQIGGHAPAASSSALLPVVTPTATPTGTATATPTPTPTPTQAPGQVSDTEGFNLTYITSQQYTYYLHPAGQPFNTPCVAAANASVTCYLEGAELDLFMNGMQFQYNVPTTLCAYVGLMPYYYWKWDPNGTVPAVVHQDTDANGNICYDPSNTGDCTSGSARPTETCTLDYSKLTPLAGPNCCEGNYTLVTRAWNAAGSPPAYGTPTVTQNNAWGGQLSSCLSGPATATQPKDTAGFPEETITPTAGTGLNAVYTVASPISKGLLSNIWVANAYDADQYSNAGLTYSGIEGLTMPINMVAPYYQVKCYDPAKEMNAEIDLIVRSWHTELPLLTDAQVTTAPFTPAETDYIPAAQNEPAPFSNYPDNDFVVWDDIGNAAPAFSLVGNPNEKHFPETRE